MLKETVAKNLVLTGDKASVAIKRAIELLFGSIAATSSIKPID